MGPGAFSPTAGVLFLAALVAPAAFGQRAAAPAASPPSVVGTVTSLNGPAGSALVIRGNTTYSLKVGDQLIAGDQVFTRFNGSVVLAGAGCGAVPAASAITLTAGGCSTLVQLAAGQTLGGIAIGGAGGSIAPLLGALAAAGAAAAAGSGGDSPASPR